MKPKLPSKEELLGKLDDVSRNKVSSHPLTLMVQAASDEWVREGDRIQAEYEAGKITEAEAEKQSKVAEAEFKRKEEEAYRRCRIPLVRKAVFRR